MTLKKEIMAALEAEDAVVQLNELARIRRWKKDALGEDVDRMQVVFKYVAGVKGGWRSDIEARDYDGILEEVGSATRKYMEMCADQMAKNMKAGYR